jgi:glycosyltransferase involved in cell wall biosynthesis
MVFWVPFAVIKGIQILRVQNCDLIYTSSPPHSEQLIGYVLSKLFRKPWIADFRDPILDSSGYVPSSKFRLLIDKSLENLVVKNSDKIIIISNHYRKLISARYPKFSYKFIIVTNGYDSELFRSVPVENFDKFTIVYSGSFYAKRSPKFFLRGLSRWLAMQPAGFASKVQVFFYGFVSDEAKMLVFEEELESVVHFPGMIPHESLIPKIKGADLLLLIIGFDAQSKGTVTSKIFEYMASQRPILAIIPEGDAYEILKYYHSVYWVGSENEELLLNSLNQAYRGYLKKPNRAAQSNNKALSYLNHLYDAQTLTRNLSNIFSEILLK